MKFSAPQPWAVVIVGSAVCAPELQPTPAWFERRRFAAAANGVVYGPDGARRGDVEIPAGLAEIQVPRGGFVEVAR